MKDFQFQIKSNLNWRRKSLGKRGFGIHSPFLFHLVSEVIHKPIPAEWPNYIENRRKQLKKDNRILHVTDFGAGIYNQTEYNRTVGSIARKSTSNASDGRLMYHLANHMQCKNIIELGTSFGIATSYLAHAISQPQIITLEGCPETSRIAMETFEQLKLKNTKLITGLFEENLPKVLHELPSVDFVFFDGNHRYEPTIKYFSLCLPKANNQSVFVFHDIHQNVEMEQAWQEIILNPSVTLSLDFYRLGVIFFKKELSKQHFLLRS